VVQPLKKVSKCDIYKQNNYRHFGIMNINKKSVDNLARVLTPLWWCHLLGLLQVENLDRINIMVKIWFWIHTSIAHKI